jgi:hypothetical protein
MRFYFSTSSACAADASAIVANSRLKERMSERTASQLA